MATTTTRLPAGVSDARSLGGMLSRGAANYGSSMSANGAGGTPSYSPEVSRSDMPIAPAIGAPTPAPTVPGIGNSGATATDFDYWSTINNIYRDTSELDSEAGMVAGRTKSDLANAYEGAARNYKKTKEAGKNLYANNGMLFSGGFVKDQADIGEAYSRDTQNITTAGQRAFEDQVRATTSRKNLLAQQKLDVERQQAQAKANEDLKKSLIEAQTKAYNDLKAGLTSPIASPGASTPGIGSVMTPTGPAAIGSPGTSWGGDGSQSNPYILPAVYTDESDPERRYH